MQNYIHKLKMIKWNRFDTYCKNEKMNELFSSAVLAFTGPLSKFEFNFFFLLACWFLKAQYRLINFLAYKYDMVRLEFAN